MRRGWPQNRKGVWVQGFLVGRAVAPRTHILEDFNGFLEVSDSILQTPTVSVEAHLNLEAGCTGHDKSAATLLSFITKNERELLLLLLLLLMLMLLLVAPTHYSLLTVHYLLLTAHYPLPTTLLTTHCLLLTTYCLLLTASCLLLATYRLLLTTYCSPPSQKPAQARCHSSAGVSQTPGAAIRRLGFKIQRGLGFRV